MMLMQVNTHKWLSSRSRDMPDAPPAGIDTSRPNIARIYDYWLGGKDNFAVDREQAERSLELCPGLSRWAQDNRAFVCGAAARAAREAGISQFLDLGAGLPTHPAVHEAVREVDPAARVAYVDFDGVAVTHAQALLATTDGIAAVRADLADREAVLTAVADTIDLSRPVAVLMAGVLHFMAASQARRVCAGWISRMAPGSWLILAVGRYEDAALLERLRSVYSAAEFFNHSPADFASFFAGTDVVPPGISEGKRWLAGVSAALPKCDVYVLSGAAVKR
jgi:O-methyltransferase involved in polyketide biosynthesis